MAFPRHPATGPCLQPSCQRSSSRRLSRREQSFRQVSPCRLPCRRAPRQSGTRVPRSPPDLHRWSSPPSFDGANILPAPPLAITEAAADVMVVPDALVIGKVANADRAAARTTVRAALEISTAETVEINPHVPAVSAEAAASGGSTDNTQARQRSSTTLPLRAISLPADARYAGRGNHRATRAYRTHKRCIPRVQSGLVTG